MRTLETSEAGLIALAGEDPRWIWGAPRASNPSRAPSVESTTAVRQSHPGVGHVKVDGETLEELGRLWYLGKGWPDPEEKSRESSQIKVESWKPGEVVACGEAMVGVRQDIFRFDERVFEAVDLYCVAEGCSCGEVVLDFAPVAPRGAPTPGAVRVDKLGEATVEPEHEKHRERLGQLWAAFQKRHPRYRERFARRSTVMQRLAGRIVGAPRAGVERRTSKVGRNDPCPCGSGKKYKKCCAVG